MLAKKFALGLAIAIVFPAIIYYLVSTLTGHSKKEDAYTPPTSYEDYDAARKREEQKQKDRVEKEKSFRKVLFGTEVAFGLLAFISGALLMSHATGAGLMFGGLGGVSVGSASYWEELSDGNRLGLLVLYAAVIAAVGILKIDRPLPPVYEKV